MPSMKKWESKAENPRLLCLNTVRGDPASFGSGISTLTTTHPLIVQHQLVQTLAEFHPNFILNCGYGGILQVFEKLVEEIGTPVDFELPESFNKWKPTPYSFIKRNVYLAKKVKKRQEDDGIYCSCSSMPGSSGVCARDCLCGMLRSSCSSACNCGISCVNKPFHQRPVKKMKTVETEKCGLGVVAEEDINKGEFVIEYVGEVIDDKTCEERLWKMKHRGETNFYLCEINRDMVIDATYKGNKSRYINHSCCPNTEMQKWMIDGETRIGIFATRDIVKGEHLTYDYQFVQFGADQDCFCGATDCRKKLGVKPNKLKLPSSDAALKIVACQVAANSPKMKAAISGNHIERPQELDSRCQRACLVHSNGVPAIGGLGRKSVSKRKQQNCIGSVIRILQSLDRRSFGVIRRFDKFTRRHLVMFEDGSSEFLDLSKEEWEFCNH